MLGSKEMTVDQKIIVAQILATQEMLIHLLGILRQHAILSEDDITKIFGDAKEHLSTPVANEMEKMATGVLSAISEKLFRLPL